MKQLYAMQEATDTGSLQVNVTSRLQNTPIKGATITLSYTGDPDVTLESVQTDESGQTQVLTLDAPPVEYSLDSSQENQPFSLYTIQIRAEGYQPLNISGIEIFSTIKAIQNVAMTPLDYAGRFRESIDIPVNTLFGDYPPKIEEAEIKPIEESGEIVLSRVVIPEFVVVHDGPPTDSRANDYYVRYKDYIKNVASSEIYATWPDASIRANVLAIMSFTLNRVFTEWYRNKGYNFTITSSTAYDQKWSYGRTIYDPISRVVDEMFENYLSRPNVIQPILTQYCDGRTVSCPNWLSQWGSKYLGDQGYTAVQILRNYYGNSIYINSADEISGIPSSWPGYDLSVGSSGSKVRQLQQQLNRIHQNYPAIPTVTADGIFGPATRDAVRKFQSVFGLPATGIVDYPTWYKISEIYVAVSRIAELV
ncbi:MAG: peptidoglycan-binding protein [bacterium]|nr:peptidoglycan-binding protein [bacterium]MDY4099790.1 peptidoglycan-binding protein [Lachnospiraceae bacterium]